MTTGEPLRPQASLDDLLTYEEPKPTSHRERPTRWLLRSVLVAAAGALVGYAILRLSGLYVPYLLLFAALFTVLLLRRVLRGVPVRPVPESLRQPPATPVAGEGGWGDRDGLQLAVTAWDARLSWLHSRTDPRQFIRSVQPRLVQIMDERLRLRHGVTIEGDPQRARELLGEQLWLFVTRPVTKNPTPREFAALVKHVEEM
ncbi:MAG TPA: hypothetical protein VJT31_03380 [Rugosimonospora sp.]|nr:hypothetical protein [Rugosimonospora sp.]